MEISQTVVWCFFSEALNTKMEFDFDDDCCKRDFDNGLNALTHISEVCAISPHFLYLFPFLFSVVVNFSLEIAINQ
jgi:hypothetical protein